MLGKTRITALRAALFLLLFAALASPATAGAAEKNSFRVGSQEYSYTPPAGFVEVIAGEHRELYADVMDVIRSLMPEELRVVRYFVSDEDHRQMLESGDAPMSDFISIIVLKNLPDQHFSRKDFKEISAYLTPDRIEQQAAQNSERTSRKMSDDYDVDLDLSLSSSPTILADTDNLFSIGVTLVMEDEDGALDIAEITSTLYLGGRVFMVQQCRDIYEPEDLDDFVAGYRDALAAFNFQPLHSSSPAGGPANSSADELADTNWPSAGLVIGGILIFLVLLAGFILVVRRILRPRA